MKNLDFRTVRSNRYQNLWLYSCLPLFVLGCGGGSGGPTLYPVSGVVTKSGAPLGKIRVTFVPEGKTKGLPAFGVTDASGRFSLRNASGDSGIAAGSFKVVLAEVLDQADQQKMDMSKYTNTGGAPGGGAPPPPQAKADIIPAEYLTPEKSPKVVEVKGAVSNIAIDLQ